MLLIVSAHVALLALAMSAKVEMERHKPQPTPLIFIPQPLDPPPVGMKDNHPKTRTADDQLTRTKSDAELPPLGGDTQDGGATNGGDVVTGGGVQTFPPPIPAPVHHDARLLTSPADLKPPYPESKVLSGEEATLHLRLTISDTGRVTAVDSVGPADRVFLEAARRYLIAHWRYEPATEDGRPVSSSIVINLRFLLDG